MPICDCRKMTHSSNFIDYIFSRFFCHEVFNYTKALTGVVHINIIVDISAGTFRALILKNQLKMIISEKTSILLCFMYSRTAKNRFGQQTGVASGTKQTEP